MNGKQYQEEQIKRYKKQLEVITLALQKAERAKEELDLKAWVLMSEDHKWVRRIPTDEDMLKRVCAKWDDENKVPVFFNEELLPEKLPTHFKKPYNDFLKAKGYVYSTQERFTFVKPV
jgi:hypothetical protein